MAGELDTGNAIANAGGIFTGIGSTILGIFGLVLVLVVIYFIQKRGLLVQRPYHVTIIVPWNNTYKIEHAKGRFLLGKKDDELNQFEIAHSFSDIQKTAAPSLDCVFPDRQLFCISKDHKNYSWIKDVMADLQTLKVSPISNAALVLAHLASIREAESRFSKANVLLQYAPIIGLLVIGIMIALANWMGSAEIAKAFTSGANSIASGYGNVAAKLENATIIIAKNPPAQSQQQPANTALPSFIPP